MRKKSAPDAAISAKLSGRVVNVQVINQDGSIDFETGGFDNLILDQGLNQVAVTIIGSLFASCAVGIGNSVPIVSQVGLDNEIARTNNYLNGQTDHSTTRVSNTQWVMRRTFEFAVGQAVGNLTELGFSPNPAAGANLFSRVLVKSGGAPVAVTVTAVQSLRVVYELTVNFDGSDQAFNANFGGAWGVVTGTGRLQNSKWDAGEGVPIYTIGYAAGRSNGQYACLEPSAPPVIIVSPENGALEAVGTGRNYASRFGKTATLQPYTAGSFFRDRTVTFDAPEANFAIQTIYLSGYETLASGWALLMAAAKLKTNTASLTLTFRIAWSR